MTIKDFKRIAVVSNPGSGITTKTTEYNHVLYQLQIAGCIMEVIDLTSSSGDMEYYSCFGCVDIARLSRCDVALVFGGDGTKNFIANILSYYHISIPILGIGFGTMNVGKLTSISFSEFDINNDYAIEDVDALALEVNEGERYYAFHDVIVATTFVGNYKGKITQLSAKHILRGIKKEVTPEFIGGEDTCIIVKRAGGTNTVFPPLDKVGIIGIGELKDGLATNVLAGGADHPATMGVQAGVIVSPERFVWPGRSMDEFHLIEPVQTYFASFELEDKVEIANLKENAHFIIDGNALPLSKNACGRVFIRRTVSKVLHCKERYHGEMGFV